MIQCRPAVPDSKTCLLGRLSTVDLPAFGVDLRLKPVVLFLWNLSLVSTCPGLVSTLDDLFYTFLPFRCVVALLKLLVFIVLLSLSIGLESFQAISLLWRVIPVSRVVSACGAIVLHLAWFWCLWWHHVLVISLLGVRGVALSAFGTLCAGRALWLYRCHCGVAALPCLVHSVVVPDFDLGPSEVDVSSSTFAVVLFPVQFVDVLSCLALPTSDVFLGFASVHVLAVASCVEPFSGVLAVASCSFPTSWRSGMLVLVSCDSGLTWLLWCSGSFASAVVGVSAPLASRDSLSQEFVVGRSWWRFVAPCIANSVSCEHECSCTMIVQISSFSSRMQTLEYGNST
ncbi:hypothetical protein Taro_022281 [Colocasia esculenta]|uniref:Uncharacterized protein n=1 Tax=Colocasia esculenta TaxID=4460 RepID=A0A843V1E4_COLES|nr:hypothetical protein [Colocasia esculenta]